MLSLVTLDLQIDNVLELTSIVSGLCISTDCCWIWTVPQGLSRPAPQRQCSMDQDLEQQRNPACILSNAKLERLLPLVETIGIPSWQKHSNPAIRLQNGLQKLQLSARRTAMVGDQLFSDVLAGRLAGLYTILVRPTSAEEPWFTRSNGRWNVAFSEESTIVPEHMGPKQMSKDERIPASPALAVDSPTLFRRFNLTSPSPGPTIGSRTSSWLWECSWLSFSHAEYCASAACFRSFGLLPRTCLLASSNYVINEILDAPTDKAPDQTAASHSFRQGLSSVAYAEWILLGVVGLLMALPSISSSCSPRLLLVMGIIYNIRPIRSKDLPYLDVCRNPLIIRFACSSDGFA